MISEKIKFVMPATGQRAVFAWFSESKVDNYEDTAPLDEFMWVEPVLFWEGKVRAYKQDGAVVEECSWEPVILHTMDGDTAAMSAEQRSLCLDIINDTSITDSQILEQLANRARKLVKTKREYCQNRSRSKEALHLLRTINPERFRSDELSCYWRCRKHNIESRLEISDRGYIHQSDFSRCTCLIRDELREFIPDLPRG